MYSVHFDVFSIKILDILRKMTKRLSMYGKGFLALTFETLPFWQKLFNLVTLVVLL